jgi:hypothetical protein
MLTCVDFSSFSRKTPFSSELVSTTGLDLVQCEEDDLCSEVTYTAMAHDEELGEITGGSENFYEVTSR